MYYAALVLDERDRAIWDQEREGNSLEVVCLEWAALEGFRPGLRYLFAQPRVLDPVDFRPEPCDSVTHRSALLS